jgi:hypothetical protein
MIPPLTVQVFAGGEGARWIRRTRLDLPERKHEIMVGLQALISRTAAMLFERGMMETVFFGPLHYSGLVAPFPILNNTTEMPLLDAMRNLALRGTERTVFLLGDVVFSNRVMNQLLGHAVDEVRFAGRQGPNLITGKRSGELFGVSVPSRFYDELDQHCAWMTARGQPRLYPPKLWALARMFAGVEHQDSNPYLHNVGFGAPDWTDDVDSPEEYTDYFRALSDAAIADDAAQIVPGPVRPAASEDTF